ncbi:TetR/AcrR family transcriptional regulator [Allokutzneria sp. A3M-2-11 16]|uniref:TetR/AcrR family transcriptional regulator n=1 Tax=Allokutzneria sp. A3M-2-11 16 TaxID=2962043 RepID=UPI0035A8546D
MAAPTLTPRGKWIEEGLRALAAGGPETVRVDPLAKALGVTRGGFYWHFTNRQALLEEMLDAWERMGTDEVIERVETEGGDPRGKVVRAGALTFSAALLPVDLAVRDWARRDPERAGLLARGRQPLPGRRPRREEPSGRAGPGDEAPAHLTVAQNEHLCPDATSTGFTAPGANCMACSPSVVFGQAGVPSWFGFPVCANAVQ